MYPYQGPPVPPQQDGGAVASMVLGICGLLLCGLLAPVALIIGFSARSRIRQSGGYVTGDGYATAGIIMGAIGTAIIVLAIVVVILLLGVGMSAGGHP